MVVFDPTEEAVREYQERRKAYAQRTRDLAKFARLPTVTRDGEDAAAHGEHRVSRGGGRRAAQRRLRGGALPHGVPLPQPEGSPFREEHFQTYRKVAEKFVRHPVTIRTFDLGGDKFASRLRNRRRDESGDGAAGDPVLPEGKGDLQAPAPGDPARLDVREGADDVPDDLRGGGAREAMAVVEEVRGKLVAGGSPRQGRCPSGS